MTAGDLYHGWFYHHGALRLAAGLGWGLQMMKADTRRKRLREAGDLLEQAWASLSSQTSILPFRDHPRCMRKVRPSMCSIGSTTTKPASIGHHST